MLAFRRYIKKVPAAGHIYRQIKKFNASMHFKYNSKSMIPLDGKDLIDQFESIGIYPGDEIIVNSSLSSIGVVNGGADTFVKALKEYITKDGLIVMSTYPHTNSFKYLEKNSVFDVLKTPSKNGVITEVFRKSEGVFRSLHPTHSLAAWGRNAEEYMKGHEKSTSLYDTSSPYKKLLDEDVKVLLIGVNLNHAVMIRVIDDLYSDYKLSPYIPNKVYCVDVIDTMGEVHKVKTPCHDPKYSKERNNMVIFPYVKSKIIFGKLGKAETWVFSSQHLYQTQIECAQKGIYPFYNLPLKGRKY